MDMQNWQIVVRIYGRAIKRKILKVHKSSSHFIKLVLDFHCDHYVKKPSNEFPGWWHLRASNDRRSDSIFSPFVFYSHFDIGNIKTEKPWNCLGRAPKENKKHGGASKNFFNFHKRWMYSRNHDMEILYLTGRGHGHLRILQINRLSLNEWYVPKGFGLT